MDEISLAVPEAIIESLPEGSEDSARDMQTAVAGWQRRINDTISEADNEEAAASAVVNALERFEDRWERYDEYVVELRAWGQSPIYAMAWRDLYASLVQQVYADEELVSQLDRQRNYRLVNDGIRPG